MARFWVKNGGGEGVPNYPIMYISSFEPKTGIVYGYTGSTGMIDVNANYNEYIYFGLRPYPVTINGIITYPWQDISGISGLQYVAIGSSTVTATVQATVIPEQPIIEISLYSYSFGGNLRIKHINDDTKYGNYSRLFFGQSTNPFVGEMSDQQNPTSSLIVWRNGDPSSTDYVTCVDIHGDALIKDVTYYFWMQSYNEEGYSSLSDPVSFMLLSGTYTLNINGSNGGTLVGPSNCSSVTDGQSCTVSPKPELGSNVNITANADSAYTVGEFSISPSVPSSVVEHSPTNHVLTIINNDKLEIDVTVEFISNSCQLNLLIDKESYTSEHGQIKLSVPDQGDDFTYSSKFIEIPNATANSPITIVAKPDVGYSVKEFVIDDTTTVVNGASTTFELSGRELGIYVTIADLINKKVAVRFEEFECPAEDIFVLNVDISGSGIVSPTSGGSYCKGDVVSVFPTPSVGWVFDSWTYPNNSNFQLNGEVLLVSMVSDHLSGITAIFKEDYGTTTENILNQSSTLFYCSSETYKDNIIAFDFINNNENPSVGSIYHFRINFYTDINKEKMVYSAFSLSDTKRWFLNDGFFSQIPSSGLNVGVSETVSIVYDPEILPSMNTESQKPQLVNNKTIVYEKPLICGIKYYVEVQAYEMSTNIITNLETIPLILDCNRVDSYYWNYNKDKNNWLCSGQGKSDLKICSGSSQSINPSIASNLFGIFKIVWQGRRIFEKAEGVVVKTNNIYSALWDSNKDILYSSGQGFYNILEIEGVSNPKILTDSALNFYTTGTAFDSIKYKTCSLPNVSSIISGPTPSTSNFEQFCYPGELTLLSSAYDEIKMRVYEEDIHSSLVVNDEKVIPVINKKSIRLDVEGISGAYAVRVKNMEDSEWGSWINIDNALFLESGETMSEDDEHYDAYRIDNSRFLVQWEIEGNNGLRRCCCQVLTMYGLSNIFCIEMLVNFEVPQHVFKFYVRNNSPRVSGVPDSNDTTQGGDEFPTYNGKYILSQEADGTIINADGTVTVYFDAIFSEPIYSNDTNSTLYKIDEVKYNLIQQGVNDRMNQKFDNITDTVFSGHFNISKSDGIFNKDGNAFIEIVFPGRYSFESCSSDERDKYNLINADDEEISNINLLPEEVYEKYQKNRLSKAMDINKFKQDYDKDDINFKFGNPGYFRK